MKAALIGLLLASSALAAELSPPLPGFPAQHDSAPKTVEQLRLVQPCLIGAAKCRDLGTFAPCTVGGRPCSMEAQPQPVRPKASGNN